MKNELQELIDETLKDISEPSQMSVKEWIEQSYRLNDTVWGPSELWMNAVCAYKEGAR